MTGGRGSDQNRKLWGQKTKANDGHQHTGKQLQRGGDPAPLLQRPRQRCYTPLHARRPHGHGHGHQRRAQPHGKRPQHPGIKHPHAPRQKQHKNRTGTGAHRNGRNQHQRLAQRGQPRGVLKAWPMAVAAIRADLSDLLSLQTNGKKPATQRRITARRLLTC